MARNLEVCFVGFLVCLSQCVFGIMGCGGSETSAGEQTARSQDESYTDAAYGGPEAGIEDADSRESAEPNDSADPDRGELSDADVRPSWMEWPLDEEGPFAVGYRTYDFSYELPPINEVRSGAISIWYPSEDTSGEMVAYAGIFSDEDTFLDATLAPSVFEDGKYPIHLHSHGHLGFAGASANLMRHFASHGWVVVAPTHTFDTFLDNIDPRPAWMYYARSMDLSQSLDYLASVAEDDPLAGKLRLDAVFLSGHSYGGYTSYASAGASFDMQTLEATCLLGEPGPLGVACTQGELDVFAQGVRDARVASVLVMDAGNEDMFGEAGFQSIATPLMQMYAVSPDGEPHAASHVTWPWLQPLQATRVEVLDGCHQTFAIGGCDGLEDSVGFPMVNAYALAFARHHLEGDESWDVIGLLRGELSVFSHAVVSHTLVADAYWSELGR